MIGTSTTPHLFPSDVYDTFDTDPPLPSERGPDKMAHEFLGPAAGQPRYFVGVDHASTFRERIQQMYADQREITEAVAELDEYFSDEDFGERPEVRRFVTWVARSIKNPPIANEIAGEIINQGYIIALKRFGYQDAPLNVAFSRNFAREHGIGFVAAFMFGPGGAARMALADWLVDEKLHGMYRPGKAPGPAFSRQTRKIWCEAEYRNQPWPQIGKKNGEWIPVDVSAGQGKLPEGAEQVLRDSWRRYLYKGKNCVYTGTRPLRRGQNYQMVEDMVCILLEADSRFKMYRSPLNRVQQRRYDRIIEEANKSGIDPFYAVFHNLFYRPDALGPVWNKARRILYGYSAVVRQAAIDAGLLEKPTCIGLTWHHRQKAWQAQIVVKGRQKYLGVFKKKADAQAAYDKAAATIGHIPGLPDIDKIWPTWEQEKARLALMREQPQMPIICQQQDTHKERKFGLRPPERLRELVERMKRVDWLVKHGLLVFDDNRPAASPEIAIQSRGQRWYDQIKQRGQRFVIQGCTSIDKQTGRIGITIYQPGYDNDHVLAEEIYHIVFGIMQRAYPNTHQTMERWYQSCLKKDMDPTVCLDEAFSKSMALEESGVATNLPRCLIKQAQRLFSPSCRIPDSVMAEIKSSWALP